MATVGCAIICKDELSQLKRLMPQLAKLDQVVIAHNGSDPETIKYLKRLNKPFEYHHFDWRSDPNPSETDTNAWGFSYARNFSFSKIKTDYVFWIDADDMLGRIVNGTEVMLEAAQVARYFDNVVTKAPDIDHWMIEYLYSFDGDGNVDASYTRERLFKTSVGYKWVYPIHENCVPPRPPKWAELTDIKIIHLPGSRVEGGAERNMTYLKKWYDQLRTFEHHGDLPRARLLIGDTLRAQGRYEDCAKWLYTEFLQNHPDAIDYERWQSWSFICQCHMNTGKLHEAKLAALQCIDIKPNLPDGYYHLAQIKLLTNGKPKDVLDLIEKGDSCDLPPKVVVQFPLDYTYTPYLMKAQALYELGRYEESLEIAVKAYNLKPNDDKADAVRARAAEKVRTDNAVMASKVLFTLLNDFDENEKASKLYDVLPYVAQQDEEVKKTAELAIDRVRHVWDDEAYVKLYTENSHWLPVDEKWIETKNPPGRDRYEYVLSRLKNALPNGGRILDVGCSDGFHSLLYAKEGYEVVGVDLDKRCTVLANERATKWNLPAKFVHAFFEKLDYQRAADPFDTTKSWYRHFDAVVCSEVIEHVQNPAELLDSLGECAKDGAPIIITTPDGAFDKGDIPVGGGMHEEESNLAGHVRVYTQEAFETLLRSNKQYRVVEAHFVPFGGAYREHQGWQVGELRREERASGPIIRIWCGSIGIDPFTPRSLKSGGIGGSETAVIHMAKEFADRGCRVVVYNNEQGVYDGVLYRLASDFEITHESDLLISWRNWEPFTTERPNAKITLVWTHDIHYPYPIPEEWTERVDKVAVLSEFHRKWMSERHPNLVEKLWVTRNGIDPQRYAKEIPKVKHRYFYSSSPDRGLKELVALWPEVVKAIPDAELHVCYGFQTAFRIMEMMGRTEELRVYRALHSKLLATPGIVFHDRVDQDELAEIQLSSEAWLYPYQDDELGGFLETYCITALEAQAAGCMPVARLNGALPEVIQHRLEWQADWQVTDLVDVLKYLGDDDPRADNGRKTYATALEANREWALSQTWSSLADEWLEVNIRPEIVEEAKAEPQLIEA